MSRLPGVLIALAAAWLAAELWRGGVPCAAAFFLCLAACWRLGLRLEESDAALFFAVAAVYLSTFRWRGGDDGPNSLLPLALLRHGTLTMDRYLADWFGSGKDELFTVLVRGRHLSIFPIAPGLMAVPFYLLPALSGVAPSDPMLHQLSRLSAAALTALSVVFLRRALAGRCSSAWALALSLVYAFGTWAFSVSSQGLWQHGPTCLGLALGLWGLGGQGRGADALAGFGLALAFAARPDSAFVLAAAGAFLLVHQRRRLPGFLLGAAAPLALLAAYWLFYTGRLMPPEHAFQERQFTRFQAAAFAGLAASPTRGLLFFCPAALFGLWAAWRGGAMTRWLAAGSLGPWLLLCFYVPWVGGNTFGPRYFASTALVLLWASAGLEERLRSSSVLLWGWVAAAAASVLVHAAGAYLNWPGHQDFASQKAELWDWSLYPLARFAAAGGPLQSLPAGLRAAAGALVLLAAALAARRLHARLLLPPRR